MTNYLGRITKWLGYFIALLVILAATLVSIGRLLTPYLNQHKSDFENWASQLLNTPVHIEQVHISWNGYTPFLTLDKVNILDKNTNKPAFDIRRIKINIKILESLFKQQPILSYIKISGMELTIQSKKTGEFNLKGFGDIAIADNLVGSAYEANEAIAWIFSQPALVLSDINVIFLTSEGIKKSITLNELSLLNSYQKHIFSGKGTLNQEIPTHVELALNWQGDNFDLDKIKAKLYLYLEGVSLPQWFKQSSWHLLQIKEGLGSAKIWLTWDKGQLQVLQTQLQLYQLNIYSMATQKSQMISRLNGYFGWKREGENQILAGEDILIDLPHHLWPRTSFSLKLPLKNEKLNLPSIEDEKIIVKKQLLKLTPPSIFDGLGLENHMARMDFAQEKKGITFSFDADYLDVADLSKLALFSGMLSEPIESMLESLKPKGELRAFQIEYQDGTYFANNKLKTNFSKLSWNSWKNYPGIKSLTGAVDWNGKSGTLALASKNVKISYQPFFTTPLYLGKVSGKVQFKKDKKDTWVLTANRLEMMNDDLQALFDMVVEAPKNEAPSVNILSVFKIDKANHIVNYFPNNIADPDLSRWVSQAFRSGKFDSGKLVIKGKIDAFPFSENNGTFYATATAKDMDFGFALGWPVIKNVVGKVQFIGRKMLVDISSGLLMDVPLKNIHGEIPAIKAHQPQLLFLKGNVEGDLSQGMHLIQQSPLKDKMSNEISEIQIAGPMQLALNLTIPLKNPQNSLVLGDMSLHQGTLSIPKWNISIGDINGSLHFTEKSLETDNLTGLLWEDPITVQISSESSKQMPYVNVKIQGALSERLLQSFTKNTMYAALIKGGTNYLAQLRFVPQQLSQPVLLIINTDLKGITLDLPAELSKKSDEVIPSKLIAELKQNKPLQVKWIYGNKLSVAMTINNAKKGMELFSADLHLGNKGEASFQSQPGIIISGELNRFDWNKWKKYITNLSSSEINFTKIENQTLLRGIDLRVSQIIGIFQPLTNVHLVINKSSKDYTIKLNSQEIVGEVALPLKWGQTPIEANFDRLYLMPTEEKESLDPKKIPAIHFMSKDVQVQNKQLGQVIFEITPRAEGLTIDTLRVTSNLFTLNASGTWLSTEKKLETQLSGKLYTKNVADFVSYWGSPTINPVGSSGSVTFNLRWPEVPYKPMFSAMTGNINLALSPGHIVNLDESMNAKMGFGKILNLLSLESISRALTLNFSDLTEKGYSFDTMTGQFVLKNGSAYTEDARMDGSVARIEMSGRLGIAVKDYDIKLSVTPFVTGSIPMVAAIAVNPVVGIAAWAVEKIAGKAVSSATTRHYRVTGTWDKPVWVEK